MAGREGLVDEVDAVDVEHVEEAHQQRIATGGRIVPTERGHRVLERLRRRVLVQPEHLAVQHERLGRCGRRERDRPREPRRHVVEVARVDAHLVALPVHLDASAVELPLDRGRAGEPERLGDVRGAGRQHRLDRVEHGEVHPLERGRSLCEREHRRAAEVARQHRGAAHEGEGHAGRLGDGVGHDARERALAEPAGEQRCGRSRPPAAVARAEQLGEERAPSGHRAGPRGHGQRRERWRRPRAPRATARPPASPPRRRRCASRRRCGPAAALR